MSIEFILAPLAVNVAVDAIYYVTRLIRHRAGLRTRASIVAQGSENEPSREAQQAASQVVKVIEEKEDTSLFDLDARKASQILEQLELLLNKRLRETGQIDASRGKELLEELRKIS